MNREVWIYAFGQAFFSLSVAGSGSVIYGSYLGRGVDIKSSARNVAVFDTLAALVATFVIIPAMATTGSGVASKGPGLMFVSLPEVFNGMGGFGRVLAYLLRRRALRGAHEHNKPLRDARRLPAGEDEARPHPPPCSSCTASASPPPC